MFDAYKRFFRFAGEQKGSWYKGMAFELLRSIFEALQFAALLVVLRALVEQNMPGITPWVAFGIMAVSVAGAALCWYLAHNSEGHANYRMCAEKRIHIGERMKYMPMGYFNAQSLGSLTAAATSTMEDLESMSFAVIARTVVGMIRTTIFSLAILCFDWRIGLVFLLGMFLFLWVNSLLLKKSRELSPGRLAAQTRLVDAVLEYIQGMSVVRAFHGDKAANQTLNNTIEETERQNFKLERKRIPYNVLEQIVLRVTAVAVILLSIWLYLQGSMPLFTCLMVVVSAFLVYSELESAGEMFFMLPMIDSSIDRVEEIDRAPRMDEGGSVQTPKCCDISFDHVDFSYGDRKIINDVSFTIPEGTTTAIIGPSGSGKTTLTSLMARFWDVDSGTVKLGGIDVKEYALDSLLSNFSMVFQRVYLFNDSIENNIKFGKPDATHEEVVAVAKAARCHDFITALPNGYDTVIGESGATISGGERQRISIARAMLKDAPIVILDEATANVDPENEVELQEAIKALTAGKTLVMIAHRMKTVQEADQILVLDQGRIVQRGRHAELMKQGGIYADFVCSRSSAESWRIAGRKSRRLGLLIVVLFGVTVLTFFYTNLSPVDAAEALAVRRYNRPTAQQVELVREELGLDQPILQQYGSWLWNALHGDFGNSYNTGRPIVEELTAAIRPTLVMAAMALLFATLISIPLGVLSASRKGGLSDRSIYLFGIICMSLPNYWIGFMLLLAFAVYLKDFILPALALAIPMAAGNIRVFRSSLLDGYNSDFVLYARARGVSEWRIANLVSRFALPPLITMLAQSFGFMIAGSAMVESVFSIPGLGSMLVTALGARDTITINACVLLTAVIFVLVNFIADCVNTLLNPQSQIGGGV